MFLKPFRIKSNNVCKGSEKRKFKKHLCSLYPSLTPESLDDFLPPKEPLHVIKLVTYGGVVVTTYHSNREPIFFDHGPCSCPSIYGLLRYPDLLPVVVIVQQTLSRLHSGAELMLPGVVKEEEGGLSLEGIQEGQYVSMRIKDQMSPYGVAVALMSYETMVANNMRGRGFKVLHLHGDLLWEMGPMTAPTEAHLAAMPRNPFTVYDSVLPAPLPSSKFIKPTPPVTHRPDDPDENKLKEVESVYRESGRAAIDVAFTHEPLPEDFKRATIAKAMEERAKYIRMAKTEVTRKARDPKERSMHDALESLSRYPYGNIYETDTLLDNENEVEDEIDEVGVTLPEQYQSDVPDTTNRAKGYYTSIGVESDKGFGTKLDSSSSSLASSSSSSEGEEEEEKEEEEEEEEDMKTKVMEEDMKKMKVTEEDEKVKETDIKKRVEEDMKKVEEDKKKEEEDMKKLKELEEEMRKKRIEEEEEIKKRKLEEEMRKKRCEEEEDKRKLKEMEEETKKKRFKEEEDMKKRKLKEMEEEMKKKRFEEEEEEMKKRKLKDMERDMRKKKREADMQKKMMEEEMEREIFMMEYEMRKRRIEGIGGEGEEDIRRIEEEILRLREKNMKEIEAKMQEERKQRIISLSEEKVKYLAEYEAKKRAEIGELPDKYAKEREEFLKEISDQKAHGASVARDMKFGVWRKYKAYDDDDDDDDANESGPHEFKCLDVDDIGISLPEEYRTVEKKGEEEEEENEDEESSSGESEGSEKGEEESAGAMAKSWYSIPDQKIHTPAPVVDDSTSIDMDGLLKESFLAAVRSIGKVKKQDVFPLLISTFYRAHMVEECPPDLKLDVKKSSYKKLSKFLLTMQSHGVIKLGGNDKGLEVITSMDFKHPLVKSFVPHLLPSTAEAEVEDSKTKPLQIESLYMPSHRLVSFFRHLGFTKASMMDYQQVRESVMKYIKEKELVDSRNPKQVLPDHVIGEALNHRGAEANKGILRQELMRMIVDEMKPAYSITYGSGPPVIRRGKLEPIKLSLVQRMGNKKVTLVNNLEVYGIPASDVAQSLQKMAAASTTVNDVPGKPTARQVLVQGNAVKVIAKLLQENYGVPIKHIEAIDKIKPSKTQKKRKKR